ncbi:MAG: glycoside hydrolase family 9 protein [Lachnospiraceae bacterium]|jgi:endoglucanase|nr:glycoside hydrolase family 9 protein [Lachnospiraceae bacterium]MEE3461311.1 glycoside hydrolase family 9 protein [Lachnospiraceae bacterium]
MRKFKQIFISALLSVSMMVTFSACGTGNTSGTKSSSSSGSSSEVKKTSADKSEYKNMINGGDFSNDIGGFTLYTNGGSAKISVNDQKQLQVDITGIGSVEHGVQVFYDGFNLLKGGVYQLDFDVSSTVDRPFDWRVQLNGGDYHAYATNTINATKEMQHVTETFTVEESDPAPRFCFNLGYVNAMKDAGLKADALGEHSLMFDNISLKVIDDTNMVKPENGPEIPAVKVNQVGYETDAVKTVFFSDLKSTDTSFDVVDASSGDKVFSGGIGEAIDNKESGEKVASADFSDLKDKGTYKIVTKEGKESDEFQIGDDIYKDVFNNLVKFFYLQRCGTELDASIAGDYAHPACHTGKAVIYGSKKEIDVSGGWHDAGDYGRYTVSGAKAAADLLLAYKANPDYFGDDTGIPESGNGIPDVLDEVRYELEWLIKMQNDKGGVYHKVTCKNFPETVMPQDETDQLVVCRVSNTATYDFAAVMSLASGIYSEVDKGFASKCLKRAEKAYLFENKHADGIIGFKNPGDVVTGEYPDGMFWDEQFAAAASLYDATGDDMYLKDVKKLLADSSVKYGYGWTDVGYYALHTILTGDSFKNDNKDIYDAAKDKLMEAADEALSNIEKNGYRVNRTGDYEWGSNLGNMSSAMLLLLANTLSGDEKYKNAALDQVNYTFGANATGYSFVTGTGTLSPEHPHHRPSQVVKKAMPGMLVGGPDSRLEDSYAKAVCYNKPAALCYVDNDQAYSLNEITIYWNSPLVYVMAALDL